MKFPPRVSTITTSTTADPNVDAYLLDCTAGAVTLTLQSPSRRREVIAIKIDSSANAGTVATAGDSATIVGNTSLAAQYDSVHFLANGGSGSGAIWYASATQNASDFDLTGTTPGIAAANKVVVLGASKEIATITSATIATLTSTTVNSAALTGTTTLTMTSANAAALAVGLTGATNPAFVVDSSTGSQAAGLKVTGATAAGNVAVAVISSGAAANLLIDAKGTGTIGIGSVSTGAVTITPALGVSAAITGTSASASALAIGLAGATNPAFVVDASTGSQAAGLKITGAVAAGTVAAAVISSGADASLTINAKGTGTIGIGSASTGAVTITPATTITGALTPTGGVAAAGGFSTSPRGIWVSQTAPLVSTDFFDATPSTTETYVSEVFVPCNMTITGVALLNGTNVTGNVTVALADSTGTPIAAAKSASTAGSGADAIQRIPFAVAYAAKGPATYFIQVQYDSATARYNTHIIGNHGVLVQTAQTYGALTSFTPPTTFVTNVSNVAGLY